MGSEESHVSNTNYYTIDADKYKKLKGSGFRGGSIKIKVGHNKKVSRRYPRRKIMRYYTDKY